MKLNLALAQINTKLGDVNANLEKHLAFIKDAKVSAAWTPPGAKYEY
ncbi:MAG: hypothetical protein FD146_456 [Anaerolineaceae bacterium]|nr:MAG: hypothetical protein FD146_456 [Anaerolineaceae bacterium]